MISFYLSLSICIGVFSQVITERPAYATDDSSLTTMNDFNSKGISLTEAGQYEEAIAFFDKALEVETSTTNDSKIKSEIWYNKGLAYEDSEQFEKAVESYDKATLYNPSYTLAWIGKAMNLGALERYEEELVAVNKALDLEPNNILVQLIKNSTLQTLSGNSTTTS